MLQAASPFGGHLREWRRRRRLSQLDLALRAEVSARHLGFVETGRAGPSRALVLRLAEELEVPLRERNILLVAAGFAPQFGETALLRFYVLHCIAIPLAVALLIAVHFWRVRKDGGISGAL